MSDYFDASGNRIADGLTARATDVNTLRDEVGTAFDLLPDVANLNTGTVNFAVDTGTANTYLVALPQTPLSYTDGLLVTMRPLNSNSGASTINVDGLGVKSIRGTDGLAISAGDIVAGIPVELRYSTATGCFHLAPNSAADATAAAASAVAAAASAAAALISENAAAASALSASGSASTATTKASEASASAAAALTSENNAELAETNAETALNDALAIYGSIAAVQAAESSAAASAVAAAASESAAQTAETNAETAETNAETAQTAAAASASSASSSASAAATSYSNSIAIYGSLAAVQSAQTAAAASATSASASATTATNQAAAAAASALSAASVVSQDLSAIDRTVFSATIVDAFLYDTSKDSDGGAWRKRCAHTSWENETLSGNWLGSAANETAARAISGATTGSYYYDTTAAGFYTLNAGSGKTATYRGNVRQFPAMVLITVEAARVVLWDITQAGCPMWMVFAGGSGRGVYAIVNNLSCASMLNGLMSVGANTASGGFGQLSFVADIGFLRIASTSEYNRHTIANRNVVRSDLVTGTTVALVDRAVNDVAMTVLPNAPVDVATGLPVPTIAVATNGGVSVIKDDGNVWDIVPDGGAAYCYAVAFTNDKRLMFENDGSGVRRTVRVDSIPTADVAHVYTTKNTSLEIYATTSMGIGELSYIGANPATIKVLQNAIGTDSALHVLRRNPATPLSGMIAYITKDYNSGWMPGDIRGAWLADTVAETKTGGTDTDRSVKANNLTVNGSITKAAVASGAQLVGYSGFSAANYLSQAYSANLDFGTGDFYIMGWMRSNANSATEQFLTRGYWTGAAWSGSAITMLIGSTGAIAAYLSDDGFATSDSLVSTAAGLDDNVWRLVALVRRGSYFELWINDAKAVADKAVTNANSSLSNASATLMLGRVHDTPEYPLSTGAMALWRAGATAPTAEQIKHIYETERRLFEANANCCLAGTSNAVTALAYDEETDLLHVGTSYGRSAFKGLVRVSSEATPVGAITSLAAGAGVIVQGGATAVDVYVPAYTLREELLRDAEQMAKFGQNLIAHDFTATASQEVFTLPVGWEIVAVYQQGTLKRETTAWVRTFDGFKWSVDLVTGATVSDWISILAKRV